MIHYRTINRPIVTQCKRGLLSALVALPVVSCSCTSHYAQLSAQSAAERSQKAVPQVTRLIPLTEGNDGNHLLGQPNGYSAASVLVDSRARCPNDGPGVDCGATIEQWPDRWAAQRRADYIQQVDRPMPIVGQEWTTVRQNLLLRVTGKLKLSDAQSYQAAFTQ
jgi:serine/threonine protein kinase, bacterial